MRTIIRTTNPNGTYRYEIDGEVAYKASKVLYTHATTYSVNDHAAGMVRPTLFHKTEGAARRAKGYPLNGWEKTGMYVIEDGDAVAVTHGLKCTENSDIAPGVRMERRWNCTCGEWSSFGYDRVVKSAFREHLAASTDLSKHLPTSDPTPATASVELWDTYEGQTHGYDTTGNRVIEISERVRDTAWTVATNVRSWAVLGDGITRHGVLASGKADGLRAAKKAALAAFVEIAATPLPEPLKVPRVRAKVVANAGPSHLRGRQGRVQSKDHGEDGNLYVTVEFDPDVTWPFLVSELTLV